MKLRAALAGLAVVFAGASAGLVVGPADAATHHVVQAKHKCTKTSSGTCIRGGQFCPQASYQHSGWDAQGRRYVCKGDRTHPHWMKP